MRIGNRPNEGHAEVTACLYLPDGRVAFSFERANISANTLQSGDQAWTIEEPWAARCGTRGNAGHYDRGQASRTARL